MEETNKVKECASIAQSTISMVFCPMATWVFIYTDSLMMLWQHLRNLISIYHFPCVSAFSTYLSLTIKENDIHEYLTDQCLKLELWWCLNFSFAFTAHKGIPQISCMTDLLSHRSSPKLQKQTQIYLNVLVKLT